MLLEHIPPESGTDVSIINNWLNQGDTQLNDLSDWINSLPGRPTDGNSQGQDSHLSFFDKLIPKKYDYSRSYITGKIDDRYRRSPRISI